jgi:hypothetical protein
MQFSKGTKIQVNWALSLACLLFLLPALGQDAAKPLQVTQAQADVNAQPKYADRVYWPMMPGESLAQLANKLYPNSPILRERFIKKTMSLSRALDTPVSAEQTFTRPGLLIIPNEKAVKELTHRIRKSEEVKQEEEQLRLSYQLKTRPMAAPSVVETATEPSPNLPRSQASNPVAMPQNSEQIADNAIPQQHSEQTPVEPQSTLEEAEKTFAQQPATPSSSLAKSKVNASDSAANVNVKPKQALVLPAFEWPDMHLPSENWRGYWDATVASLEHGYNTSLNAAKTLNQQLLRLKQDYSTRNFTQVLHDYRLRNIALISVLAILFLVIGLLHRRRARNQREMLSLIKDTINHDAEFTIEVPTKTSEQPTQQDESLNNQARPEAEQVFEQRGYH